MAVRILIVDDHSVVRQGLRMFLRRDPALEIVGEAPDGATALDMVRQLHPDVVLMDLKMPGMDGITATAMIRRDFPSTEVIALTGALESDSVIGAISAGAIGYLLKDTEASELRRAVKAAAAGQVQLAPEAAKQLLTKMQMPVRPALLTERETDVLRLIARGCSNKDIARKLAIGDETVKTHVSNILSKLGVESRTQAALYAVQSRLIELGSES
jgi:DNA-binding NarL/FixJ family response regulator